MTEQERAGFNQLYIQYAGAIGFIVNNCKHLPEDEQDLVEGILEDASQFIEMTWRRLPDGSYSIGIKDEEGS